MRVKVILLALFLSLGLSSVAQEKSVGLVLSGGGALGYCHIGVLKALEENGIRPAHIAGASMGSIIGTFYAAGYSADDIMELIKKEKMNKTASIAPFKPSKKGFSSMRHFTKLMNKYIPHNSFDSLQIPLTVSVTNLTKGTCDYIGSGNQLSEYVAASACVPGVFEYQEINNQVYVDGGLMENLPADAIKDKCDIIIGVDVLQYPVDKAIKDVKDILTLTVLITNRQTHQKQEPLCDYYIQIDATQQYSSMDFEYYQELITIGYNQTIEYLKTHYEHIQHN